MLMFIIFAVALIIYILLYDALFKNSLNKLKQKEKTFLYYVFHLIYFIGCITSYVGIGFSSEDWSPSEFAFYLMPILSYILYTIPAVIIFEIYIWIQKKRENDRSMRKSNNQKNITSDTSPPIYYIAYFVTAIAVLLFIYFEYNLLYDPIGRTDKFGTHVINFFVCFTLPIILWIANAIISNNDLNNKVTSKVDKEMKSIYGSNYGQTSGQKKASNERIRTEARKRLREAKSDFEEGFLTHAEYKKILDENKPKIL